VVCRPKGSADDLEDEEVMEFEMKRGKRHPHFDMAGDHDNPVRIQTYQ
jgi:hypothetical protein